MVTTVNHWEERIRAGKQTHRERLRAVAITAGVLALLGIGYAVFLRHPG
jgi:hypothetical protein